MSAMTELVRDRWPVLAAQIDVALRSAGEPVVADLWHDVRVTQQCACGDDFCQSFFTEPPPDGAYGPEHRHIVLDAPWPGYLILHLTGEQIMFVEVLHRGNLD
jgi:hypothetical protein